MSQIEDLPIWEQLPLKALQTAFGAEFSTDPTYFLEFTPDFADKFQGAGMPNSTWRPFAVGIEDGHVKRLLLTEKGIKELPEYIAKLSHLRQLVLDFNPGLTALPEWLGELTNLEILSCNYCSLAALPDSIKQLNKLRVLSLSRNQFTLLPEVIRDLPSLELALFGALKVNLWDDGSLNHISKLPRWVGELKKELVLDLSYNDFTSIPQTLWDTNCLVYLNGSEWDNPTRKIMKKMRMAPDDWGRELEWSPWSYIRWKKKYLLLKGIPEMLKLRTNRR